MEPPLIPADALKARIGVMAREIEAGYPPGTTLHFICVLKGAFIFVADLVRAISLPVTLDFIAVSSYDKGTTSSGEVKLVKDLDSGIEGRDVLLVEDIVDTGLTLAYLQEILRARSPRSLKTVSLLSKPARRQKEVAIDHVGFTIDDQFVVGFGLDFEDHFRHLPHIGVLGS